MSLPQISEIAGAWAQLVAFSPVFNLADSGEVEILNDDIPEYSGTAGIVGTVLALLMVAVGSVKRIYAVNESNAISRRDTSNSADIYFQMANLLDKQQCLSLFLCTVAFQSGNRVISTQKQLLLQPFISNDTLHSADKLKESVQFGFKAKSQRDCLTTNPRCPFPVDCLEGSFQRARKINDKIILWLENISKNSIFRPKTRTHSF